MTIPLFRPRRCVGALADGISTYQVGSYAERELRNRRQLRRSS